MITGAFPELLERAPFIRYGRIPRSGGLFTDYAISRMAPDSLRFVDISATASTARVLDLAHFLYFKALAAGMENPLFPIFRRLEHDRPAGALFPDIPRLAIGSGEHILSANSLMTYVLHGMVKNGWLRLRNDVWEGCVPSGADAAFRGASRSVLSFLNSEARLTVHRSPYHPPVRDFDSAELDPAAGWGVIPLDTCGFVRDYALEKWPLLVFNTSFFLLEPDDVLSIHSGLFDAYGLWVSGGAIMRPPLYHRGAIFLRRGLGWSVGTFSLRDVRLELPGGVSLTPRDAPKSGFLPFAVNKEDMEEVAIYTRSYGVQEAGVVLGQTPEFDGRFELCVVDDRVVGWKEGGRYEVPQNGFVISFAPTSLTLMSRKNLLRAAMAGETVHYEFFRPEHEDIVEAIQVGPILLRRGEEYVTTRNVMAEEEFLASRILPDGTRLRGISPTDYDEDSIFENHARVAIGVDKEGWLLLVVVSGVSKHQGIPGVESEGANLLETAELLAEAGAVDAVNLDGGGSAQARYLGGEVFPPGGRRGFSRVSFPRMVPSVGVVR